MERDELFLRTKFICIIWTNTTTVTLEVSSWGLSLFVLFEQGAEGDVTVPSSWGLSLFVLFEQHCH